MYSCSSNSKWQGHGFESEGMHEVTQCLHQCNALSVMEERFHKGLKNKKITEFLAPNSDLFYEFIHHNWDFSRNSVWFFLQLWIRDINCEKSHNLEI